MGSAFGWPAGAGYGGIVPAAWLEADTGPIEEAGNARRERGAAAAAETLDALTAKWSDPNERMETVYRFALDEMVLDEERLHGVTGLGPTEFFYLVACLEAAAGAEPGAPAFGGGAGGGRILAADHALCLTLSKMWIGCAIEALLGVFKVDLATASRGVAGAEDVLANTRILPTDRAIARELAEAAPHGGALADAAGGAVSADWMRVQVERPADRGPGSGAYPVGAGTTTTYKTLVGCGADGIILFRGPALAWRGSEAGYLRRRLPGAGRTAASLADGGVPAGERVRVNLDGGPRGAEKMLRGADVRMPRHGPLRHLAQDQADLDSRLAGKRTVVESAFAAIKSYRALGNVFRGSAADLERTLTIATGIVNLKRMLGRDKGGGRLDADAKG